VLGDVTPLKYLISGMTDIYWLNNLFLCIESCGLDVGSSFLRLHCKTAGYNKRERGDKKNVCGAKLCGAKTTELFAPTTPTRKLCPPSLGDNVKGFAKVGLYQAGEERLRSSRHKARLVASLLFLTNPLTLLII
jgi:hypothetical protein